LIYSPSGRILHRVDEFQFAWEMSFKKWDDLGVALCRILVLAYTAVPALFYQPSNIIFRRQGRARICLILMRPIW
jgi:hypothetical protein